MNPLHAFIAVGLGGGIGAMSRYAITLTTAAFLPHIIWAIPIANGIGCFLAGAAHGLWPGDHLWRYFILVGFLGALTSFSSFTLDMQALWEKKSFLSFWLYSLLGIGVNFSLCVFGIAVSQHIRS